MEMSMSEFILSKSLTSAKNKRTLVIVSLMDGIQIKGTIIDFDDSIVLVDREGKKQQICREDVASVRELTWDGVSAHEW